MRLLYIALLALATLAPLAAAATYDVTASPQMSISGGFSLTSAETTIVLTKGAVPEGRVVQITCDQPFGVASATGAYATKQPIAANGTYTVTIEADTTTVYIQAASTTGTCRVSVLDRALRN